MRLDVAGSQIKGARERQEDSFGIAWIGAEDQQAGPLLALLADGVGGGNRGDVASNIAVRSFKKHLSEHYVAGGVSGLSETGGDMTQAGSNQSYLVRKDGLTDTADLLKQAGEHTQYIVSHAPATRTARLLCHALAAANHYIAEAIEHLPTIAGMASTLIAALIEADKLWWVSVGDSHVYLLRGGQLHKKNAVHNLGSYMDTAFPGRPEGPMQGGSRKLLVSALTGTDVPMIDCPQEPLQIEAGDCLVLASDGLDALSAGKIRYFLDNGETAEQCTADLLEAVESVGAPTQDNTTVIVVKCLAE